MSRTRPRTFITAAAGCAVALGAVLVLATPASAADVDPAPIRAITAIGTDDVDGLAVAGDGTIYVAQDSGTIGILVFAPGATGNASPERTINGNLTTLSDPNGLAIDASGNLWVADENAGLLEFAAGASGNVAPIRTIVGGNTGLNYAIDVKIGSDGTIYAVDGDYNGSIDIFAANANGDATPIRSIAGANTGFDASGSTYPYGMALQPDGSIVVSVRDPDAVETFGATANGDVAPLFTITGASTELSEPDLIATDHVGTIYAGNYGSASVTEYPQNATGDVAPTTRIVGATSTLAGPYPVAIDSADHLFVGDYNVGAVDEFAANLAVTSVSPATGNQNGGTTVTIHGYGFAPGATVTFGGTAATNVHVTSSTTITAVVPAHALGKVDVAVTQDGITITAADAFTYAVALATTGVDSTPAMGAGIVLLLVGGVLLLLRRRTLRSARA